MYLTNFETTNFEANITLSEFGQILSLGSLPALLTCTMCEMCIVQGVECELYNCAVCIVQGFQIVLLKVFRLHCSRFKVSIIQGMQYVIALIKKILTSNLICFNVIFFLNIEPLDQSNINRVYKFRNYFCVFLCYVQGVQRLVHTQSS